MELLEVLENSRVRLEFAPLYGGKISQIKNLHTKTSWLFHHPRLQCHTLCQEELSHTHAYTRFADFGGWDECCPTIAPCQYPIPGSWYGLPLLDHGDCWCQTPIQTRPTPHIMTHTWQGQTLPYQLHRQIVLDEQKAQFTVSYCVTSKAKEKIAILWSSHPLFHIIPGMQLHIPDGIAMTIASSDSPLGEIGTRFFWPICNDYDLRNIMPKAGWAVKLFSDPLSYGDVQLSTMNGESIQFSWQESKIPLRLGLWLNYHGWSGDLGNCLENIGIELCLGMPDALCDAILQHAALFLEADSQYTWSLVVSLQHTQVASE